MLEMAPTAPELAPVSRLAAHPAGCGMPCTNSVSPIPCSKRAGSRIGREFLGAGVEQVGGSTLAIGFVAAAAPLPAGGSRGRAKAGHAS